MMSLDGALGTEHTGTGWALTALAAGAAGSALVMEAGRRAQPSAAAEPTVE